MTARLNPYLNFDGNAREAMEFYAEVFGGKLTVSTFGEYGAADSPIADKVMHAMLESDLGFTLMASDMPPGMAQQAGNAVLISLSGDDAAEGDTLRRYWKQLSDGGTVTEELKRQMWGDDFGMCTDRFGIGWMVNIGQQQA